MTLRCFMSCLRREYKQFQGVRQGETQSQTESQGKNQKESLSGVSKSDDGPQSKSQKEKRE